MFIGDDELAKKDRLSSIKAEHLDKGLKDIDFEIIYSDNKDLLPPKFDEVLSYFPANKSKKRIILIKKIENLEKGNRDVLIKHLKVPSKSILLILDSSHIDSDFVKELEPFVITINFKKESKAGVFDLTRAIVERKTADALLILNNLLKRKEKPHHILGALIWQWDSMKPKISLEKFKQGLKLLLDTDIKIKTGRLEQALALEMVVIRLSYLA